MFGMGGSVGGESSATAKAASAVGAGEAVVVDGTGDGRSGSNRGGSTGRSYFRVQNK